jgi:flagellar biosynthesis protein FliQ
MYEVGAIVEQSVVTLMITGLPLLLVVMIVGVISLVLQSLTLVKEGSLMLAIRIVLLFVVAYSTFPTFLEHTQELLRLCLASVGQP